MTIKESIIDAGYKIGAVLSVLVGYERETKVVHKENALRPYRERMEELHLAKLEAHGLKNDEKIGSFRWTKPSFMKPPRSNRPASVDDVVEATAKAVPDVTGPAFATEKAPAYATPDTTGPAIAVGTETYTDAEPAPETATKPPTYTVKITKPARQEPQDIGATLDTVDELRQEDIIQPLPSDKLREIAERFDAMISEKRERSGAKSDGSAGSEGSTGVDARVGAKGPYETAVIDFRTAEVDTSEFADKPAGPVEAATPQAITLRDEEGRLYTVKPSKKDQPTEKDLDRAEKAQERKDGKMKL